MNFERISKPAAAIRDCIKGNSISTVLFLVLLAVAIIGGQSYCDNRAIEKQTEQIKSFDRQTEESRRQTEALLDLFNKNHQSTLTLLDAMQEMNGTINTLVENDLKFNAEVNNLKGEYDDARNPETTNITKNGKTIRVYRNSLSNRPLRMRELDVLANDKKLYATGAGEGDKRQ